MRILELRKGSAEEAELLEAAAAAHGNWVLAAAPLMKRLWLMRSAWAPGLRYIGGLAAPPDVADMSGLPPLSVGGAGLRLEDALAGCLAEAVERTAQVEREGDVVLSAPLGAVRVPNQIGALIDLLIARNAEVARSPIDWVTAKNVTSGDEILIPADWCLRRRKPLAVGIPEAALSTGCAAAATSGEALARGLLELIERDAAGLWWLGGRPATGIRPGSIEAAAAGRLGGELRQAEDTGRTTYVLDITSDIPVPVMAAIASDGNGTGLSIGLAARPSPAQAAGAALVELCQMELGLQLAFDKRTQLGETALTDVDRRHLARAAAPVSDLTPLDQANSPGHGDAPAEAARDPSDLAALAARADVEAWQIDLTRPSSGLRVAKVIAPRLQPMPGAILTERLTAVQKLHGNVPLPSVSIM